MSVEEEDEPASPPSQSGMTEQAPSDAAIAITAPRRVSFPATSPSENSIGPPTAFAFQKPGTRASARESLYKPAPRLPSESANKIKGWDHYSVEGGLASRLAVARRHKLSGRTV